MGPHPLQGRSGHLLQPPTGKAGWSLALVTGPEAAGSGAVEGCSAPGRGWDDRGTRVSRWADAQGLRQRTDTWALIGAGCQDGEEQRMRMRLPGRKPGWHLPRGQGWVARPLGGLPTLFVPGLPFRPRYHYSRFGQPGASHSGVGMGHKLERHPHSQAAGWPPKKSSSLPEAGREGKGDSKAYPPGTHVPQPTQPNFPWVLRACRPPDSLSLGTGWTARGGLWTAGPPTPISLSDTSMRLFLVPTGPEGLRVTPRQGRGQGGAGIQAAGPAHPAEGGAVHCSP